MHRVHHKQVPVIFWCPIESLIVRDSISHEPPLKFCSGHRERTVSRLGDDPHYRRTSLRLGDMAVITDAF